GAYVRRWVPELANLPAAFVHQPWRLPPAEQCATGFTPGLSYPTPVVDFAASRAEALAGFERVRNR
ncbi:FAD-binding domain-containing protein, partial [Arthrospira platensis SPKY1]|nr:FAD-binding domain-containing protein [Arthrospira platensis SPKY1]